MKKLLLLIALITWFAPESVFAQRGEVLVGFRIDGADEDYDYQFVKKNNRLIDDFWRINGGGWTRSLKNSGPGAFGTQNNTQAPPCPSNDPDIARTQWPSSRHLLMRKVINIPNGARNLRVQLALDNGAEVYFNGKKISGVIPVSSDGCAEYDNPSLLFTVDDSDVRAGNNYLAVHGIWLSAKNFLDVQVKGDLGFLITINITGPGTVSPISPTFVFAGEPYTATYDAGEKHHVASINLDGEAPEWTTTSTYAPPSQVFPLEESPIPALSAVTANHTIDVVFEHNKYPITVDPGDNGTIELYHPDDPNSGDPGPVLDPALVLEGEAFKAVVNADFGFHVAGVTTTIGTADPVTEVVPIDPAHPLSTVVSWEKTYENVTAPHTIVATFAINYYAITLDPAPNVSILSADFNPVNEGGVDYYMHGTTVTVWATAPEGQYVKSWTVNGTDTNTDPKDLQNPLDVVITQTTMIRANYGNLSDVTPKTFSVGNSQDDGDGSLRQAIADAQNHPGVDNIVFDGSAGTASNPIQLLSPLSATDVVIINETGGLVHIGPGAEFDTGVGLPAGPGVYVKWGYDPGGITISGLHISGFPEAGICLQSDNNTIEGSTITGNAGDGICITGNNNTVGGLTAESRNTIYGNDGNGVSVKRPDADFDRTPSGNAILGNSIYGNGGLGIDHVSNKIAFPHDEVEGITWNRYPTDPSDWAKYVNNGQNFPDLQDAGPDPNNPSSFVVRGWLYGPTDPSTSYRVEIFRNSTPDPRGAGEGNEFIGASTVSSVSVDEGNGHGIYKFEVTLDESIEPGELLSATATDQNNNTSEFSTTLLAGVVTRIYGPLVAETAPDNRWIVNTTFSGIPPLHWPDGAGKFAIGSSTENPFPADFVTELRDYVLHPSYGWNNASSVQLSYSENTAAIQTDDWGGNPDGKNNLVFANSPSVWESKVGPNLEGVLAVTRVRYNSFSGEIYDADVIFNGGFEYGRNDGSTAWEALDTQRRADFKAVTMHEFGHVGGLGDFYNRGDPYYSLFMGDAPAVQDVTMYGIVNADDTFQHVPWPDDEAGLAFIYGNVAPGHIDLMLVIDASQSFADPATFDGFEPSRDAAIELIDKLRVGDGIGVVKLAGPSPAITLDFARIPDGTPTQIQSYKDGLKADLALLAAAATDEREIGLALQAAAGGFSTTDVGRRAIILLSAGNENGTPSALDPAVLAQLAGGDPIRVFAMGFAQGPGGADLGSQLADATDGAFYETDNTTISAVVNQIWDNLVGYQLLFAGQAISWQGSSELAISWQGSQEWAISWQGASNLAISWQGKVDKATSAIFPAISWQGKTAVSTLTKSSGVQAELVTPKFHLALVTPDFFIAHPDISPDDLGLLRNFLQDYSGTTDPVGTITPGNWQTMPGVEYVTDDTYAFYRITGQYEGTREGDWFLVPIGANGVNAPYPVDPVPINIMLATATDVLMEVEFDKSNYGLNEPVHITVNLFEGSPVQGAHTVGIGGAPILDAIVSALVTFPGGATQTIPFTHLGDGVYAPQTPFDQTGQAGTYSFQITAERDPLSDGDEFRRQHDQAIYVLAPYTSIALFAGNSVTIQDGATINSGDILVNRDAQTGDAGVELFIGAGVTTPVGYAVKADRIQIASGATVSGEVHYNELNNGGTITGDLVSPLLLPVMDLPPFETTDPGVATASDFNVKKRKNKTLTPGTYRDVTVEPHGSLTLTPGVYHMRKLLVKSDGDLLFEGPTQVRVRNGMSGDNGSYFGPVNGGSAVASDVIFYVQGTDAESSFPQAVNMNPKAVISATIYAQNGTLFLDKEATVTGAFIAEDLVLGNNVDLTLESAIGGAATQLGSPQKPESNEPLADADVPTTYVLSQNYPNPFNPSTQIRYGLPKASHVTLTIYNMIGQEVVRLVDDVQAEGYHVVQWNGTNDFGNTVSSGMYIFRLTAEGFVQTKKMMLLK